MATSGEGASFAARVKPEVIIIDDEASPLTATRVWGEGGEDGRAGVRGRDELVPMGAPAAASSHRPPPSPDRNSRRHAIGTPDSASRVDAVSLARTKKGPTAATVEAAAAAVGEEEGD